MSLRFPEALLARIKQRAKATGGNTSSTALAMLEEYLRVLDHPGITFRDGASGRRAGLLGGPDVWEVIDMVRRSPERGEGAVAAAADMLTLERAQVRVAVSYYSEHSDEIDAEIRANEDAAHESELAYRAGQRLLS